MPMQRITVQLTELRCIAQSEAGGSEPYLWTTFFAFGAEPLPFQSGPVAVDTPSYDAFRTEFPNNMKAGQAVPVPSFVASASFDMDLDLAPHPKLIGAIAVLLEQDSTPDSSIILGRIAFSKEIDKQLNALISKRIQTGDTSPLTDQEINAVKSAVKSKVKDAIKSDQSFFGLLTRDQDDIIGFVYKVFAHPPDPPQPDISFQYFDFPEITSGSDNRFVLSGRLSLGPVPTPPVDRCATQRAALKAKTDQIHALETRITSLQTQLQHASPSQKAFIVQEITATGDLLTQAEAELPALQAALDACESRPHPGGVITGTTVGVGRDNR